MDSEIIDFLNKEHVGALSVLLPNNTLHSAAVHFSYISEPNLVLYFSTDKDSKKCEFLKSSKSTEGSFTLGFSEQEWKTLQIDGKVELVEGEELVKAKEIHYLKNPGSKKFADDPATVFLKITPVWWRYSDLGAKPPKFISNN